MSSAKWHLFRLGLNVLRCRRPFVGLILTSRHRAARSVLASEHQNWKVRHWRPVLITDENRFNLSRSDGRVTVWKSTGERYQAWNIVQHDRFSGGSVMVWGGISLEGRTDLYVLNRGKLTVARYRDEILRPIVRPFGGVVGPGFLLVHDNARPHVARVCQRFLEDEGIDTIDWLARCPDLNPIEHPWNIMDQRIWRLPNPPRTVQELTNVLIEVWQDIDLGTIRRLIRSMRCRVNSGTYLDYHFVFRHGYSPYSTPWPILISFTPDRLRHFYKQKVSNLKHSSSNDAMMPKCSPNCFEQCMSYLRKFGKYSVCFSTQMEFKHYREQSWISCRVLFAWR